MKNTLLLLLLLSLPIVACKKKGCTDPSAFNYDTEAEKNDESCTYNGRAMCWFNSVTATNCVNASIPSIDFYIDGVKQGTVSMVQFSVGQPACGSEDGITATIDLGSGTSVSKNYSIQKGGTTDVLQSGTVLVSKDVCHWVQFVF